MVAARRVVAARRALAALAVLVLGVVAPSARAQDKGTLRFAYLRLGWSGTEIIHQEKLLENRGWNVEWSVIDPIPGLVNAFAAGHADVIDMSTVLAGRMFEQGQKVQIFGVTTGPTTYVLVPTDSPIRSVPDLKGRKLGAIPGSSAFQEMNAYTRQLYNVDLTKDVALVTGMTPPDLATLIGKGEVDSVVVWHPVVDSLLATRKFRVLTDQDTLWRQSTKRSGEPVMVLYLTGADFARKHPEALRDINDAQREAVEIWHTRPDVAARAIVAVTRLPRDVVELAMRNTKKMLHGLTDDSVETILTQLRIARQHGTILQSDCGRRRTAPGNCGTSSSTGAECGARRADRYGPRWPCEPATAGAWGASAPG